MSVSLDFPLVVEGSRNRRSGACRGYSCRRVAVMFVHAARPAEVGRLLTRLWMKLRREGSQDGFGGMS